MWTMAVAGIRPVWSAQWKILYMHLVCSAEISGAHKTDACETSHGYTVMHINFH